MKLLVPLLLIGQSLYLQASCNPELSGSWVLDYQNFLDKASKGDAAVREELNEVFGGKPHIKFSFNVAGRGTMSQRNNQGWHISDLSYQVTQDTHGNCTITLSLDNDSAPEYESMALWTTPTGFCWKPVSANFEDCYISDELELYE